jgi:hypothetical protein
MIRRYEGSQADELTLANWWVDLVAQEALQTVVPARQRSLTAFLAAFREARVWWATGPEGVQVILWAHPWLDGATVGLWVHPAYRRWKAALRACEVALEDLLAWRSPLVALVKDTRLRTPWGRMGFVFGPTLPALYDGADVAVGVLTPGTWASRRARRGVTHGGR